MSARNGRRLCGAITGPTKRQSRWSSFSPDSFFDSISAPPTKASVRAQPRTEAPAQTRPERPVKPVTRDSGFFLDLSHNSGFEGATSAAFEAAVKQHPPRAAAAPAIDIARLNISAPRSETSSHDPGQLPELDSIKKALQNLVNLTSETGWKSTTTSDGRTYYYHKATKQTSWHKPPVTDKPEVFKKAANKVSEAIENASKGIDQQVLQKHSRKLLLQKDREKEEAIAEAVRLQEEVKRLSQPRVAAPVPAPTATPKDGRFVDLEKQIDVLQSQVKFAEDERDILRGKLAGYQGEGGAAAEAEKQIAAAVALKEAAVKEAEEERVKLARALEDVKRHQDQLLAVADREHNVHDLKESVAEMKQRIAELTSENSRTVEELRTRSAERDELRATAAEATALRSEVDSMQKEVEAEREKSMRRDQELGRLQQEKSMAEKAAEANAENDKKTIRELEQTTAEVIKAKNVAESEKKQAAEEREDALRSAQDHLEKASRLEKEVADARGVEEARRAEVAALKARVGELEAQLTAAKAEAAKAPPKESVAPQQKQEKKAPQLEEAPPSPAPVAEAPASAPAPPQPPKEPEAAQPQSPEADQEATEQATSPKEGVEKQRTKQRPKEKIPKEVSARAFQLFQGDCDKRGEGKKAGKLWGAICREGAEEFSQYVAKARAELGSEESAPADEAPAAVAAKPLGLRPRELEAPAAPEPTPTETPEPAAEVSAPAQLKPEPDTPAPPPPAAPEPVPIPNAASEPAAEVPEPQSDSAPPPPTPAPETPPVPKESPEPAAEVSAPPPPPPAAPESVSTPDAVPESAPAPPPPIPNESAEPAAEVSAPPPPPPAAPESVSTPDA
eukprot:Hpha_TRINITY_DN16370_c4_g1::TRINITY_DN16370_c4_g1_i4::g.62444::m.62444